MTDDYNLKQQLAASNCGLIGSSTFGCPPLYYPTPITYNPKQITVEAVDGGYVINGHLEGKGVWRTVAINSAGLVEILQAWSAQFQAEPK